MRSKIFMFTAAIAASACQTGTTEGAEGAVVTDDGAQLVVVQDEPWDGTGYFLLNFIFGDVTIETTCEENFKDASCNEPEDPDDSDWTSTNENTTTNGSTVGQIVRGRDAYVYLLHQSRVYQGMSEDVGDGMARFRFNWEGSEVLENSLSHKNGWMRENTATQTGTATLTFDIELSTGKATIAAETKLENKASFKETDEWMNDGDFSASGQIQDFVYRLLEYDAWDDIDNDADTSECADAECEVKTNTTTTTTYTGNGDFITDDEAQDLLSNNSGPPSVPGGVSVPSF